MSLRKFFEGRLVLNMEARLLAFLGIAIVLTITPGPDMALVARVVFGRGRTAAWFTSLGVVTGHLLWGVASALGVAAVLNASATLYTILRLVGAGYLIWLGVHALFSRTAIHEEATAPLVTNNVGAYRQGLINDLLNPKIGAFYTTLLPQFIGPGQPVFLTSVLLTALFALIVVIWLAIYILILANAGQIFRRPTIRRTMERITGVVLVGLGIRLALEQH
jgi:threonine/homoserine/homoserine lactone efflux protein